MSFGRNHQLQVGTLYDNPWSSFPRKHDSNYDYHHYNSYNYGYNYDRYNWMIAYVKGHNIGDNISRDSREPPQSGNYAKPCSVPPFKRRKFSENSWVGDGRYYERPDAYYSVQSNCNAVVPASTVADTNAQCHTVGKRDRSVLEDNNDAIFFSRDEIERCSPSRKDGINAFHETQLRYSYCAFIQNLGLRLNLPQTTIGTAMVLCHRFFLRRSHACHDRFLIATAALFLAAKSEETARPLNDVLRVSREILHKPDLTFFSHLLPINWFEQYRERVLEAEQLILTTLNFELNVQHPYDSLTAVFNKLGLAQTVLVNLALNVVSEGVCTRLDARLMIFLAGGLMGCRSCVLHLKLAADVVMDSLALNFTYQVTLWMWQIAMDIPISNHSYSEFITSTKKKKMKKKK